MDSYEADHAIIFTSGPHTLTPEMRQKNLDFRKLVSHLLPIPDRNKINDCDLIYRFLIARQWKFKDALENIEAYVAWRKQENLDNIMTETLDPQIEKGLPAFFGFDVEGFPLLFDTPDPILIAAILKDASSKPAMIRAHLKLMEQARYLQKINNVDRISWVLDLTHISFSTVTSAVMSFLKEVSHMDQRWYPEVMRRMLICNGGWFITGVWNVIKPLLDKRVQAKISFYKTAVSVEALGAFITVENMHPKYGGTSSSSALEQQLWDVGNPVKSISAVGNVEKEMPLSPFNREDEDLDDVECYSFPSTGTDSDGSGDDDMTSPATKKKKKSPTTTESHVIVCSSEVASKIEGGALHSQSFPVDCARTISPQPTRPAVTQQIPSQHQIDGALELGSRDIIPSRVTSGGAAQQSPSPQQSPKSPAIVTEIRLIRTSSTSVRGYVNDCIIAEKRDDQIFSTSVGSTASPFNGGNNNVSARSSKGRGFPYDPPPPILVGELLEESGHFMHRYMIVCDHQRNAQFILMKRNIHDQIIIFQICGDTKVFTDKKLKHTVTGEKVKFGTCGPRDDSNDKRDWIIWGKVRVGTATTRKYIAEKKDGDVVFFSPLSLNRPEILFCLAAGLMQLWES